MFPPSARHSSGFVVPALGIHSQDVIAGAPVIELHLPGKIGEMAAELLVDLIALIDRPCRKLISLRASLSESRVGALFLHKFNSELEQMTDRKKLGWGLIGASDIAKTRMIE